MIITSNYIHVSCCFCGCSFVTEVAATNIKSNDKKCTEKINNIKKQCICLLISK